MKVERVSYEVMTPSAARAIFEAILWKPAFDWWVERIEVLAPIRWVSIRRNEVASKVPTTTVMDLMAGRPGSLDFFADEDRQQRASLLLRDVAYRTTARMVPGRGAGAEEPLAKYGAMFRRRAAAGQCVSQPYLGCREFDARVRLIDNPAAGPPPIADSRELGVMLFDLDYTDPDHTAPIWFRARLDAGVVRVPDRTSAELLR